MKLNLFQHNAYYENDIIKAGHFLSEATKPTIHNS